MKELEKTKRISVAAVLFILIILIGLLSYKRPKHIYAVNPQSTLENIVSNDFYISQDELAELDMELIDVRNKFEFEKGHIENALNMYAPEILNDQNFDVLKQFDAENKFVVLYGANPTEALAPYMMLYQIGIKNLKILSIETSYSKNKLTIDNVKEENSGPEFEILTNYLEKNGNYIYTSSPSIILASEINENLKNDKYLVVDIRNSDWYGYGHIKNSKNVNPADLLSFFENEIDPKNFDKIAIACYSGQSASYYTSLLRLYGIDNVYSLKWGMSSWTDGFAKIAWAKNSKDGFSSKLEKKGNPKPSPGVAPILETRKRKGKEILKERLTELFSISYSKSIVNSTVAFKSPQDYFIINYTNEDNYNTGHLKGAVHYQPNKNLASEVNLLSIPADKKILVNSNTGLNAAYLVAYLDVLGYDTYNLAYGSNSYMNSTLVEKKWNGWTKDDVKNYPVEGKPKPKKIIPVKKKKKMPVEGGC